MIEELQIWVQLKICRIWMGVGSRSLEGRADMGNGFFRDKFRDGGSSED